MMEILNVFPPSPARAVVVLSSLLCLPSAHFSHPGIAWLTHWQLYLAIKGKDELMYWPKTVVLLGLVMTYEKRLEAISFFQKIGMSRVCFVPDDYQQLEKWLYPEPEREAYMPLPLPAGTVLKSHPRYLVVGFDSGDFSEEVKGLKRACFVWRSQEYSFNGQAAQVEEVFVSGRIGTEGLRQIKRALAQDRVEPRISVMNAPQEVVVALGVDFQHGAAIKQFCLPVRKEIVVVFANQVYFEGPLQFTPWFQFDDRWDMLPVNMSSLLVSLDVFRFHRIALQCLASARGVRYQEFGCLDELQKLLQQGRAQSAQQAPAPVKSIEPVAASAPQTEPVLEARQQKEDKMLAQTQSAIIRANLDAPSDELVRLVQLQFPDAKRNSITSIRGQILAKQKKQGQRPENDSSSRISKTPRAPAKVEEKTTEPEAVISAAAMLKEAWKLIDQARVLVETMQARLERLAPFEKAMMDMLCDEHDK